MIPIKTKAGENSRIDGMTNNAAKATKVTLLATTKMVFRRKIWAHLADNHDPTTKLPDQIRIRSPACVAESENVFLMSGNNAPVRTPTAPHNQKAHATESIIRYWDLGIFFLMKEEDRRSFSTLKPLVSKP